MKHILSFVTILLILNSCSSPEEAEMNTPNTINSEPLVTYTLNVNTEEGGSVDNTGGTYESGTSITITATPESGFQFQGWSNGSTSNPLTIILNESVSLTAQFSPIQNNSRNFDFNDVKSIVIKSGTSAKIGKSRTQRQTNIQKINFDGDISDIDIENATSYLIEANSAFRINESYAIITGYFRIVFDNGFVFEAGNILVDLSTGEFYSAGGEFFGNITFDLIGRRYKNPHMNSGYQVDGQGRIYKKAYEVASNVYGIERVNFRIENESAIAEIDEVLCVAPGAQYFYYQVASSGDILFGINRSVGSRRRDFSYRKSNGETILLDNFNENSFNYDLEILGTDDKFLVFRLVKEFISRDNFNILENEDNNTSYYDVFKINSTSEGIQIDSLKRINPARLDNIELPVTMSYNTPIRIHNTYSQDDLFFVKDKDDFRHFLKLRHYTDDGVYISKITQGISNPDIIEMTSLFTPLLTFSKMGRALGDSAIVEAQNDIFFADGRNIIQFNFIDMTVDYFVENSDISFSSFILQPDDTFLFWGFSLSTSQKVLGEIDRNGTITILETIEGNVEIQRAIRIGSFNN